MIVGKQHVTAFPGLVQAVPTKKPSFLVRRPMYNPIAGVIHIRPPKSLGHSDPLQRIENSSCLLCY